MKSKIAILSSFVCLLFSGPVFSQNAFYGTTITGLNADSSGSAANILFVKVTGGGGGTSPACHTSLDWNFAMSLDPAINPSGKYLFTLLMAAQSAGTHVDIIGLQSCTFSGIQAIQRVATAN